MQVYRELRHDKSALVTVPLSPDGLFGETADNITLATFLLRNC